MKKLNILPIVAFGAAAALVGAATLVGAGAGDRRPALPQNAGAAASETIVLAGGCFWGVQAVFQHVDGVQRAVSGYAGGKLVNPSYGQVSTGTTGHAESVEVTFDPKKIRLGEILRIYFSVAHDPTEVDRQGPDQGTQYRSEIFATDAQEAAFAQDVYRRTRRGEGVAAPDRDQGRAARRFLSCGGLPSELRDAAPLRTLRRFQRSAEAQEPEAPVPGGVSRDADAAGGGIG